MSRATPPLTPPPKSPQTRRKPASAGKEDFLLAVLECMEGSPKIDFEKLAHKMNYKSGAVANARFHQIKRAVIKASELTPTSPPSAPPPAPAAAAAKKAVEKKRVEKVAEDGVVKKRGRGRPRKVVVAPAAPVEPMGGEGGRGERAFGEDFGGVAGAGGIDPRILEMGGGRRVKVEKEEEGEDEEEADTEVEGEEGKGVRFVF